MDIKEIPVTHKRHNTITVDEFDWMKKDRGSAIKVIKDINKLTKNKEINGCIHKPI